MSSADPSPPVDRSAFTGYRFPPEVIMRAINDLERFLYTMALKWHVLLDHRRAVRLS